VSAITYATEALGITDQTSFLLLDLREPEEYEFWRIKEAILYPA
jgi:centrosomal protein CEP41